MDLGSTYRGFGFTDEDDDYLDAGPLLLLLQVVSSNDHNNEKEEKETEEDEEKEETKVKRTVNLNPRSRLCASRETHGLINLFSRLNETEFKQFTRMKRTLFYKLLNMITPFIQRKSSNLILAEEKLGVTLRYFASGNSFADLKFICCISQAAISSIVMETSEAIIKVLNNYIQLPKTEEEWKKVSDEFYKRWGFPHCIGAIDGKHINIIKPGNSGDLYLNYKNTKSIILMAIADANYKFLMVDVGANGRAGDVGMLKKTVFYKNLIEKKLNIPKPDKLPNSDTIAPYVFVGDNAFPLMENLVKPYNCPSDQHHTAEDVYDEALSRNGHVVEKIFAFLSNRFRIFYTNINLSPEKASIVTLCCCYLHNYLEMGGVEPISHHIPENRDTSPSTTFNKTHSEMRDIFKNYLNSKS